MIINRELSWLDFNDRVMQEARDSSVPLLQRLRFLGIFSNNQDEFIKVRVANVIRISQLKNKKTYSFSGDYTAKELLELINKRIMKSQQLFSETYNDILSEMQANGIRILNEKQLNSQQELFCHEYFSTTVSSALVPLIVRKGTKMPFLLDNYIYHAIKMSSAKKTSIRYAVIQIPVSKSCPRFVELPSEEGHNDIIYLDDIIRLCLNDIFFMFNYSHISAYTFKITRDAQFTLEDDLSKSLIEKMEDGLDNRLHGQAVRFVYDKEMPEDMIKFITSKLNLKSGDIIEAGGRYHLKRDLMKFPKVRNNLEDTDPKPLCHPDIIPFSSILNIIWKKDILLNYPYHTFNHFIDFLREAAIDPKVESIYITLYRTADQSKVINALINAAKNGKKVVAILELFARFDEEQNVENSELLQKVGVKVIHGLEGLKVHSKIVLVERKSKNKENGFAYIGTGNFNEATAQRYTDLGLFTANSQIVNDVRGVFRFLMNTHLHFKCKCLMVAPYYMRKQFEELIDNEIEYAKKGKKAYIHAKFNSLTDEEIIKRLYKASQAGVDIRLIIRGACSLKPQVEGLSENIRIISIVDKYLEHARLAIFNNGGDNKIYILSADWMTRNLDRRVEVGTPILDKRIQQTLKTIFKEQWSDNVKARDLSITGENNYVVAGNQPKCRSQIALYEFYKKQATDEK